MTKEQSRGPGRDTEEDNLVTERDNDETFGLFRENSFPGALDDEDQRDAIRHAYPPDRRTSSGGNPSSGETASSNRTERHDN